LGVRLSEGPALRVRIERPYASLEYGMITEERTNGRWPSREMLRSSVSLPRGRAEPAPPRDGQAMGTRPSGGKPRDGAKGGFLGGMRSARPRGKAGHEPRHNMIIGGKGTPGALAGPRFGQARALPAGVRSPPLRGVDHPRGDGLAGRPRDNAKGGFVGGMRSARPECEALRKPRVWHDHRGANERPVA
jgi:hypothetical protein